MNVQKEYNKARDKLFEKCLERITKHFKKYNYDLKEEQKEFIKLGYREGFIDSFEWSLQFKKVKK